MNKDFDYKFLGFPFTGVLIAFFIATVFQVGEASFGIMSMLGIIAGYLALLASVLEKKDTKTHI